MVKTVFELDNDHEICDSLQVRIVCGSPSNHTWDNHRQRVGVRRKARVITLRQAFLLWVSVNLYRNGKRRLSLLKIIDYANEILERDEKALTAIAVLSGSESIPGKQIPEVIERVLDKRVSIRTIYRRCNEQPMGKVPRFSQEVSYTAEQVRRIIKAIA